MSVVSCRTEPERSRVATSDDDVAYRQGYEAYWNHVPMKDNPYQPGTKQYVAWDRGWIQGQLEECDE